MNAVGWRVVTFDGKLRLRVTRWSLCRLCLRGHLLVEHDDQFLRYVNMDNTPVLHKR